MTTDYRALCAEILQKLDQYEDGQRVDWEAWRNNARAALAQSEPEGPTGRPAIEPVPVAERLPGPEDCSSRGYFWAYAGDDWEETDIDGMNWQHLHHHGYTHWLPHHALPIPAAEAPS